MSFPEDRHLRYKVVETSQVHDKALEDILNEWVENGWSYDGMQFAMHPSSRRPTMAFVLFTRKTETSSEEQQQHDTSPGQLRSGK